MMALPTPRLVDLVNEVERRLGGSAPGPGLDADLASRIPEASTYVLVLFDGLGARQLSHPQAPSLRASHAATIAAPFPTTTTVSMATVATGMPPGRHGVIGHYLWLPALGEVVNVLKWVTPRGEHVSFDTAAFLPSPNLWERLSEAGVEPITVQPAGFADSPLTKALYRGCRFEPVHDEDELIEATVTLARRPNRLVFTYLAHVDFAAHVWGQRSPEYAESIRTVDNVWSSLRHRIPDGVGLIGTADHGHIDYGSSDKISIRGDDYDDLVFAGDPRSLMVRGDLSTIRRLATETGATLMTRDEIAPMLGGAGHPELEDRIPDAVLLAPDGKLLLPKGFDKRLTGYHGGLDLREVEVPLLVG